MQNVDIKITKNIVEKIFIIDRKIFWFDPLHVEDKRNNHFCIRCEHSRLFVNEFLRLYGLNMDDILDLNQIKEAIDELNEEGVGFCSRGHKLIVKRGSRGIFLECNEINHAEKRDPTEDIIERVYGEDYLICPECEGRMKVRKNPRDGSVFLGCSNYPRCKFTRPT